MTTVVITQPNYLPWRGYFDQMDRAELFVLLTDVQYTRRDWRNRNRIRTEGGLKWITVPVVKGPRDQLIRDTEVRDEDWPTSHWDAIRGSYSGAAAFEQESEFLETLLEEQRAVRPLHQVCRDTLVRMARRIGIDTPIVDVSEFLPLEESQALGATDRLVTVAHRAGATRYVTGPAAADYMDVDAFSAQGIDVGWMDYSGYASYEQVHDGFDGRASIVDALLNVGAERASATWSGGAVVWGQAGPA